jgi:hypothetical protein
LHRYSQEEIDRQRNEARVARKHARSEHIVNERSTAAAASYRRGLEEQEAHASKLDEARAEAQKDFERDGVHALAAAGCMEATLQSLGLMPADEGGRGGMSTKEVSRVETAYKRGLASNHPDRSASRGEDLAGAARCEEIFKLLQAAHARWTGVGKPVGARAAAMASATLGAGRYRVPSTAGAGAAHQHQTTGSYTSNTHHQAGSYTSNATSTSASAGAGAGAEGRSWQSSGAGAGPMGSSGGSGGGSGNYQAVGTLHHITLQSKHQLMTVSSIDTMVHVTNLTTGSECNPTSRTCFASRRSAPPPPPPTPCAEKRSAW